MKTSMLVFAGMVTLSAALTGCGAEEAGDWALEESETAQEQQSSLAAATGCAALTQTGEAHTGALLGYNTPHPDIFVKQIKFMVKNPSAVDCALALIEYKLTNDLTGRVIAAHSWQAAVPHGKTLTAWQTVNFDSRTYTPKVGYDEDVFTYSNGRLLRATYLPQYFISTNQF